VLEADALVDFFLKDVGYEGDHMADRLGKIRSEEVKTLEQVWKAHRVRNDIAHTPGYRLSEHQAQETLNAFRAFLIEMGAL
jgi:glucuronate isomerase